MTLHESMARQGLVRPQHDRVLGGVCAGLGRRFGIEPWPTRLLFILVLMVLPGSQILLYPILWILMPSEEPYPYPPQYGYAHQYGQPAYGPAQYQATPEAGPEGGSQTPQQAPPAQ